MNNLYRCSWLVMALVPALFIHGTNAFLVRVPNAIRPSSSRDYRLEYNRMPNNEEEDRMKAVRDLQELFYKNETSGILETKFGILDNLSILRSPKVQLPGFQSLLNVTDPLEIHMFLKLVHSSNRKFGHLYRREMTEWEKNQAVAADSSQNDSFQKEEEKYKIGTLMQVSDYQQDPDTGHLIVLVQGLARFTLIGPTTERWDWMSASSSVLDERKEHATVEKACVELLPDDEFVTTFLPQARATFDQYDFTRNQDIQGAACAGAIAQASEWRLFETEPMRIPQTGQTLDPVSSLAPFEKNSLDNKEKNIMEEYLSQSPIDLVQGECSIFDHEDDLAPDEQETSSTDENVINEVLKVEHSVWVELDKLVKHLSKLNPKSNTQMPIPLQILSLLPFPNLVYYWPPSFQLAKHVRRVKTAHSILVNNKYKQNSGFRQIPSDYPPLRRARRLSYILWNIFLEQDTMEVPSDELQRVLETHSISDRLKAGLLQLQTINRILQQLIETK